MSNCTFTDNNAINGDNVHWYWTVETFLNKYNQINDFDYVYIRNGVGSPSSTIVLNKKGITITSQGNVIFDGKGKNLHFEITGNDILIDKLTFRNFNFTGNGGAIQWIGSYGILKNCNFINNTADMGGCIRWQGANGIINESKFYNNTATNGACVFWSHKDGIITESTFSGNHATVGGAIQWNADNGSVLNSIFNNNNATTGGAIYWSTTGLNGNLKGSTFTGNSGTNGGAGMVVMVL